MPRWTGVFDINASIRIIRHISGGIYRNPANAMKELIVNAFDAGATRVDVEMSGPTNISKIVVSDNGSGLTEDDMLFSFQHLGSSLKKLRPEKSDRPVVGQFGIGLLASAHASTIIQIETTPKDKNYTLEIEIDLSPFFKYEKQIETLEEFTYGNVKYKKKEGTNKPSGTKLTLEKKGNEPEARRFWGTLNRSGNEYFKRTDLSVPRSVKLFDKFGKWVDQEEGGTAVSDFRGYEEFLWQLGLILPVEYLDEGPVAEDFRKSTNRNSNLEVRSILTRMRNRVKNYDFHVYVDGVEVKRPILLPSNARQKEGELGHGEWATFPIHYKKGNAEAEGYLFFQPYRVYPTELRGIYRRLKGVGVGQYDNTLFKTFRKSPILAYQISGELDLLTGFDDALNLDRTDFIETDSAYMDLVGYLEKRLSTEEDSILFEIRSTKGSRDRRKKKEKLEAKVKAVEKLTQTVYPGFQIKSVPRKQLTEMKDVQSDYSLVKVSYKKKYVAVSQKLANNPLLIKILLVVDKVLRGKPYAEELSRELKEAISRAFHEDRILKKVENP